jgi:RNA recognition motif-containing protein
MTQKLFIGGLSFSTSSERLREFFGQVEGVESASVVTDRATGQSRGFGFVEMASLDAANSALRQLNGHELDGRQLRIELANPSTGSRGPRGGGGRPAGGNRW